MGGITIPVSRYNDHVTWIYLSPHFDDVALSCGGLVWEQSQAGDPVSVWTICAAEPSAGELSPFAQELHTRWQAGQNAPSMRRLEDYHSCQRLGASYRYFSIPDCIYRRHPETGAFMYASEASLNGPLHPGEAGVIRDLRMELQRLLPPRASLVCPLALGTHVDHQLTRCSAEQPGQELWYYADFPYVLRCKAQMEQMEQDGWSYRLFRVSQAGLLAWQDSIAAHASQISTFWPSELVMRQAIQDYLSENGGIRLWRRPQGG